MISLPKPNFETFFRSFSRTNKILVVLSNTKIYI